MKPQSRFAGAQGPAIAGVPRPAGWSTDTGPRSRSRSTRRAHVSVDAVHAHFVRVRFQRAFAREANQVAFGLEHEQDARQQLRVVGFLGETLASRLLPAQCRDTLTCPDTRAVSERIARPPRVIDCLDPRAGRPGNGPSFRGAPQASSASAPDRSHDGHARSALVRAVPQDRDAASRSTSRRPRPRRWQPRGWAFRS